MSTEKSAEWLVLILVILATISIGVEPEVVPEEELEQRRTDWRAPESRYKRGYASLYTRHVNQADQGCDFDFLTGTPGSTREPDIF